MADLVWASPILRPVRAYFRDRCLHRLQHRLCNGQKRLWGRCNALLQVHHPRLQDKECETEIIKGMQARVYSWYGQHLKGEGISKMAMIIHTNLHDHRHSWRLMHGSWALQRIRKYVRRCEAWGWRIKIFVLNGDVCLFDIAISDGRRKQ